MPTPTEEKPTTAERMKAAQKRAVFVTWVDSSGAGHWMDADFAASKVRAGPIYTVGYVLREDDEEIVLVQSLDFDNDNVGHTLAIPKVAVLDVWEIDQ
jgi:hypothetical protein